MALIKHVRRSGYAIVFLSFHWSGDGDQSGNNHSCDSLQLSAWIERRHNPMESPIVQMYSKLETLLSQPKPAPICSNAKSVAIEAYDHLRCHHYLGEAEQLVNLLSIPHIKSILLCHDIIANKAYGPTLPEICHDVDEDDVTMKIVTLIKEDEPLGATVKINEHNGTVSVTRIMSGGAADRSKAIDAGDAIRKINGIAVQGKGPMEVVQLLLKTTGEVKLNLTPSTLTQKTPDQNQVHVRTLFSYSPLSDPLIPHPEAGLAFLKGEILRLIKTDDPNWWKAIKVEFAPGGPVASVLGSNANQPGLGRVGLIPSKSHKAWKSGYRLTHEGSSEEPVFYEEVERYFPEEGFYRPIVLVGPPGVGKTELVQQLINTDPTHFREPIRITTRKPREGEVHGVDYLFVTDDEFNTFVEAESLIDQSPVTTEGAIGLCLDAVLEIIQAGQVAVFEADYRNLRLVRSSILKPFVIFIKPPALDVLLETRMVQRSPGSAEASTSSSTPSAGASPARSVPTTPRLTGSYRANRRLGSLNLIRLRQSLRKSDEELGSLGPNITSSLDQLRLTDHFSKSKLNETQLHEMLQIAARLEVSHGHMWDYVLINDDLPVALEQLSELAYRIETEAFWVPSMWVTAVDSSSTEQLKSDPSGSMVAIK